MIKNLKVDFEDSKKKMRSELDDIMKNENPSQMLKTLSTDQLHQFMKLINENKEAQQTEIVKNKIQIEELKGKQMDTILVHNREI